MKDYNTNYCYRPVHSREILSDPAYQREIDFNRVKNIASHFNPALVNPIKVSQRDGKYYVFDGQHTLAVLKMRNGNEELPVECKVYTGLTQQDEAKLFVEQNGIARNVKTNAKMKALFTAGDPEVIELRRAVESVGVKIDFSCSKGPYKIVACATTFKVFRRHACADFQNILLIIKESWGANPEGFNKEIIAGVDLFYTSFKEQIDIKKVSRQFNKVSPQEIIREGRLFKEGGDRRFARQLVIAYNKGLRGNRLPEVF